MGSALAERAVPPGLPAEPFSLLQPSPFSPAAAPPVHKHGGTQNLRHCYDRILLPRGLLVLGDAYVALNPVRCCCGCKAVHASCRCTCRCEPGRPCWCRMACAADPDAAASLFDEILRSMPAPCRSTRKA